MNKDKLYAEVGDQLGIALEDKGVFLEDAEFDALMEEIFARVSKGGITVEDAIAERVGR